MYQALKFLTVVIGLDLLGKGDQEHCVQRNTEFLLKLSSVC